MRHVVHSTARVVVATVLVVSASQTDAYARAHPSSRRLPAPTVTTVTPAYSLPGGGGRVTVVGTGLHAGADVSFGSAAGRAVHVLSATRLTVTTPAHASGLVHVHVRTQYGASSVNSASEFGYGLPPTILSSQTVGAKGDQVLGEVEGVNLAAVRSVHVGSYPAQIISSTPGEVQFLTPHAVRGTLRVTVTTRYGSTASTPGDELTIPTLIGSAPTLGAGWGDDGERLDWADPHGGFTFADWMVRRAVGHPQWMSPTSGVELGVVADDARAFVDTTAVAGTQYTYALFGRLTWPDGGIRHSAASTVTVTAGRGWRAHTRLLPATGRFGPISCVSDTFCMATDGYSNFATYDGSGWSTPEPFAPSPDPPVVSQNGDAVSCASTTFCVAADMARDPYVWDGRSWSASPNAPSIDGIDCSAVGDCLAQSEDTMYRLTDGAWHAVAALPFDHSFYSCATPTWCVTVSDGKYATFDGASWSLSASDALTGMNGAHLSCPVVDYCLAVADGADTPVAFDGSAWSVGPSVARGASLNDVSCSRPNSCAISYSTGDYSNAFVTRYDGAAFGPTSVSENWPSTPSCASDDFCAAAWAADGSIDGAGITMEWNGSHWSEPAETESATGQITAVSCPDTWCVAATDVGDIRTFDGSHWSAPQRIDDTYTGEPGAKKAYLTSVSCVSRLYCVAVDGSGNAMTYDGSSWSRPEHVDSEAGPNSVRPDGMRSVSCVAIDWCVAVDALGNAITLDGSWRTTRVDGLYRGVAFASVSCSSTTRCVALDENGRWLSFDGSRWSAPTPVASNSPVLARIVCPSTSFCLATDTSGRAYELHGSTWSAPFGLADPGLVDISCSTADACASVDSHGLVRTDTGGNWSAGNRIVLVANTMSGAIGCSVPGRCVVVSGRDESHNE